MGFVGILVGLVVLGLMMTVHELGHYLVGRRLGFKIIEFQIFMGPRLFTWEKDGIKYSLRLLPIGAAVQFAGEYPEEGEAMEVGDFYERPKRSRAAVLFAGPAVNILTGIVAFFILFAASGYSVPTLGNVSPDSAAAEAGLEAGDTIVRFDGTRIRTDLDLSTALHVAPIDEALEVEYRDAETGELATTTWTQSRMTMYLLGVTIDPSADVITVMETSPKVNPAVEVLQKGDLILSVNGEAVDAVSLSKKLEAQKDQPFELGIERGGEAQTVTMNAVPQEALRPAGFVLETRHHVVEAIPYAFQYGWSLMTSNVKLLGQMFAGRIAAKDSLTGPVGIVQVFSGVVANNHVPISARLLQLLSLFGLISIALGFTNLLPIPPLDGNQLLLTGVEAIRGKRLSPKVQNVVTIVGVVMILALAGIALLFDVMRLMGG